MTDSSIQDDPAAGPAAGIEQTLPRFFDAKYEYVQQARQPFLEEWGMESPWAGPGSVYVCLTETMKIFKSQQGGEIFHQKLAVRKKVRFGILIRTSLDANKIPPSPEQIKQAEEARTVEKAKKGPKVAKVHKRHAPRAAR